MGFLLSVTSHGWMKYWEIMEEFLTNIKVNPARNPYHGIEE